MNSEEELCVFVLLLFQEARLGKDWIGNHLAFYQEQKETTNMFNEANRVYYITESRVCRIK